MAKKTANASGRKTAPAATFEDGLRYMAAMLADELQANPEALVRVMALIATADKLGTVSRCVRLNSCSAAAPYTDVWANLVSVYQQTHPPVLLPQAEAHRPKHEYMTVGPGRE